MPATYLRIAVPSPLAKTFDYLPPTGADAARILPGCRVRVPFGKRRLVGIVLEIATHSDIPASRLRRAHQVLDDEPALPADLIRLGRWAIRYYHHPPGEVFASMLPVRLRKGASTEGPMVRRYAINSSGRAALRNGAGIGRAPRQKALLQLLDSAQDGQVEEIILEASVENWRRTARALIEKRWIDVTSQATCPHPETRSPEPAPALTEEQCEVVRAWRDAGNEFGVTLLEGVTGSGKTEIYLAAVEDALSRGCQALLLVPEIGLTPQLVDAFRRRLRKPVSVLHSSLTDGQRLSAWAAARNGSVGLVIGTRSAVFTPLLRPGLVIVDEEHDGSFKQIDGFRYSARDLAIVRARDLGIPVLLGSATPALETLENALSGRYVHQRLKRRASGAPEPDMELLDTRGLHLEEGLSAALVTRVRHHLECGEQVLLFLNRRGFAPTLLCHECGWVGHCQRCDAHLTLHVGRHCLICHHCGAETSMISACPDCNGVDLRALGQGTERIQQALNHLFPGTSVARIDRDSTRRKGELESLLEGIRGGKHQLLVGTQMLAKGHDFPNLTLVAIVDADQGLFSADFRAGERLAQLVVQVAGRAGRAERPGKVIIQTRHPDHPLLQTLVRDGYPGFARAALAERATAGLPPFARYAVLRAEALSRDAPRRFLEEAAGGGDPPKGVEIWGPVPSPMERRAGRWRAQLLVQSTHRSDLHAFLDGWLPFLETLSSARKVRWSLDVDPIDLF